VRLSAKAFLVDGAGRLLLLDCADPARPGVRWWELPGGGVEPGEDEVTALVREVLEETGIAVPPGAVGPLVWTQESTFLHRGRRHWSRCHGRVVQVDAFTSAAPALTDDEQDTILGSRWWTPAELAATGERFFPRHVPVLLPRVLAGERVDEPFDDWDRPTLAGS
jgi:8-oxo-dGTP pyrophosphatase MutT (NUDIX family)